MSALGVHPRLAHMLLRARQLGLLQLGAQLSALLSERDLLRGGARDVDVRTRLEILRGEVERAPADRGTLRRTQQAAAALERQLGGTAPAATEGPGSAGLLLAFAYPDRIGRRRAGGEGRFALANGRGAHFGEPQALGRQEFIVAVDVDDRDRDARILLAAPLELSDLLTHFAPQLVRADSVAWNTRERAVLARRTVSLGALVLEDRQLPEMPPEAALRAMLEGLRQLGVGALPWDRDARDLQARIEFVRAALGPEAGSEWPQVDDAALGTAFEWLAPWLDGITRAEHLARISLAEVLKSRLGFAQQRELEEWAPTHLTMPTGSRVRVDYTDASAPAVSVRLQEVFGLSASPLLGRGRVPVTFRLLSPAQRPVQVTRDLAGFWRGSYAQVRKDMRGRYPKHYWPENPLEAQPVRGTRRR
jgi:ATP-dependent helicase HrpB